jgi:hypothetical protein
VPLSPDKSIKIDHALIKLADLIFFAKEDTLVVFPRPLDHQPHQSINVVASLLDLGKSPHQLVGLFLV